MLAFNEKGGMIQFIYRDTSGCSHVRLRWNNLFLGGVDTGVIPLILPNPIMDPAWLSQTRAIIWQRPINDMDIELVKRLKAMQPKFRYKLIAEFDDMCWTSHGEGVPEYNMASFNFKGDVVHNQMTKVLELIDEVIVSTEWLKKSLLDEFGFKNVTVVQNVIPRFLWSCDRKKDIDTDIVKPRILYSGAPQHYRNPIPKCPQFPNGVAPLKGDWNDAWIEFIRKNVKEDKIEFVVMGALPWFFEDIKDKIKFIPWVNCNAFPATVMAIHPDFCIAPLAENEFNRCKSDLRFIESCAIGSVFLGSYWENSPYSDLLVPCRVENDITMEDLDTKFWELTKKDNYNRLKNWQYDYLNTNGRWLESSDHVNKLLSVCDNSPNAMI